jgi:hypothetical protein
MPRVTENQETYLRRTIRDAIALDPLMTITQLQEVVEKKANRTLTRKYIAKLLRKTEKEVSVTLDRKSILKDFTKMQETFRVASEALMKIAYALTEPGIPRPTYGERIQAWNMIARNERILLHEGIPYWRIDWDDSSIPTFRTSKMLIPPNHVENARNDGTKQKNELNQSITS